MRVVCETARDATMSGSSARSTLPLKCHACDRPMELPIACGGCHQLYAPGPHATHFDLFGIPPGYDLDAGDLRRRFLAASREIHPDRFVGRSDETVRASLELSARVNRAYEVLSDPLLRAEYVLEISGGKSAADDKRVPQEVLNWALMTREELEEARGGDTGADQSIRADVRRRFDEEAARIDQLARGMPGDENARQALRVSLNTIKYYANLLRDI